MSEKLDEERGHFQELRKELDEAIRKSAKAATNVFEENVRKQRTEAVTQMNNATKRGDLMTAKFYEIAVQQYSMMLQDYY